MKILDRYILTTFLSTFATVFVILFFIFILQGIWLFIADLAGKDLDFFVVLKFLLFYSPTIVPLVLPLSILLASIMTFGNLAENYEFAAMKSSGISLKRAMQGLTVFILILSFTAFLFANNVIPKAQYKFINLRSNIIQSKPAMAISEGQFNAIGNFNIKVEKKSGKNGELLEGVTIHKRSNANASYVTIIRAKNGILKSSESSNILQLELFDGNYYEEVNATKPEERRRVPFAKSSFSKQIMNIDLSSLNPDDMEKERISNTNTMLNISELSYTLDSLQNNYNTEKVTLSENLSHRLNSAMIKPIRMKFLDIVKSNDSLSEKEPEIIKDSLPENLLTIIPDNKEKLKVLESATNTLSAQDYSISSGKTNLTDRIKNINNHWLALYDKFVIAYACLLMFFIGAPLGAIIRKGGIGLPIVFAILIFITFHFINTFGKKVAQENGMPPFLGAWLSSFILTPFAVLLTHRATNDIGLINIDSFLQPIQKVFEKLFKIKSKKEE